MLKPEPLALAKKGRGEAEIRSEGILKTETFYLLPERLLVENPLSVIEQTVGYTVEAVNKICGLDLNFTIERSLRDAHLRVTIYQEGERKAEDEEKD